MGVVRFGSLYEYVASFGIFNGADVGKTINNRQWLVSADYLFLMVRGDISPVVHGESHEDDDQCVW